jgi:RNA polymerase sigma factor (sigma-70 family)
MQRLRTGLPPASGEHSDERLLDDFLAHRANGPSFPQPAEEAFAAIVRRHGPMVRGVCRRVLRNDADADDAFQAVFVVLLRKAEAVRPRNQLGNWLYGVAVNVARRGRDSIARRRTQELVTDVPGRESDTMLEQSDLRAVIDQELSGLPDAYRAAVVACDLEGRTRTEAAGRLGWSEGTVASRLARGRALLADRLTRRGVAIPAAGLAAALGTATADAIPVVNLSLLVSNPSPAVEALAREAMRAMTTSKVKTVAVVLLAAVGLAGAGATTVWACGGYGWFPRPNPPVSEVKPYPLSSVEANEPKPAPNPAAWEKPAPKQVVAPGIDRPAADGVVGVAKPASFVMQNPARDITVISDRHEKFVEFFTRRPVLIAQVPETVRDKILYGGKGTDGPTFLGNASFNTDGVRAAVYGASVKLAPVTFLGPVYRLLDANTKAKSMIFVRDAADKDLWHAVGFTSRDSFAFFASKDRVKPDDFAPADLIHHEKPAKKGVPAKPPEMKPARLTNPAKAGDDFAPADLVKTLK